MYSFFVSMRFFCRNEPSPSILDVLGVPPFWSTDCQRRGKIGKSVTNTTHISNYVTIYAKVVEAIRCNQNTKTSKYFIWLLLQQLNITAAAQWLRCCATNRRVAGSIPDGVIGIFH